MALGTVASLKDSTQLYTPLLLVAISFAGTSTQLLVSTHPFNSGEGGSSFPGLGVLPAGDYLARIVQQDITALQSRSKLGIDRFPDVTLNLADADQYIWTNFSLNYGFRGATMQMALLFWQPGTTTFSTDAPLMFSGVCDQELVMNGGTILQVRATNSHNMALMKLGSFPIQNRCPHLFPTTAAQRLDGATNFDSPFYGCGYNPDQGSSLVQIGNLGPANHVDSYGNQVTDANGIFLMCDYLRSNNTDATSGCMARMGNAATTTVAPDGDLMHDTTGRATGRFSGLTWSPGTYYAIEKTYTSNAQIATFSFANANIWGQYQNLLYGMQWVNCKIANVIEDGNSTRCEAMVCEADFGDAYATIVTVNGVQLPQHNTNLTFGEENIDPLLRWNWTTQGGRNGNATADAGYDISGQYSALGDTYGQVAVFEACFYESIFTGYGTPSIQALAQGPYIVQWTSPTANILTYTNSPPWVVMDLLTRANWSYAEMNIQSFIDAATFCQTYINYVDSTGATDSHWRFQCEFCLENQRTAAEVLAGVLRSFNGYLYWDSTGLLNLGINQTLADQQPSAVTGSNYNTAVSSIHADSSSGDGYVAYSFDETNIARKSDGTPDFEFRASANEQTPNQIYIGFQDSANSYQTDSLSIYDTDAVNRAGSAIVGGGAVIPETLNCIGINNFDQGTRIANVYLAERNRGNLRNDAGGTDIIQFTTSVRAEHLQTGSLVFFSWNSLGYDKQLFRVIEKQASTDGQVYTITIQFHKDEWYTDIYGQAPSSLYSATNKSRPTLPSPWQPNAATPYSDIYSSTDLNFNITEVDTPQEDGSVLVQFDISGVQPVNQASNVGPPLTPLQATVSSTGGSIPGGTSWIIKICAIDSSGNYSAPSNPIMATVPSGTNTNSITVPNLYWQAGTAGFDLFAGQDHWDITHQLSNTSSTPSSITWTAAPNVQTYGPPDLALSSLAVQAKEVVHAGIIGCQVAAVTSTTVTLEPPVVGAGPLTNDLTGYYVMLIAKYGGEGSAIPICDAKITSNSSYVLTVDKDLTQNIPGTTTPYLALGDVVIVTAQANIASSTSIGDSNYVSVYAATGTQDLTGYMVRIIAGTGAGQVRTIASTTGSGGNLTTYNISRTWDVTPDSTSLFIVEEPAWLYPATTTPLVSAENYSLTTNLATVNVSNGSTTTMLVQVLSIDPTGKYFSSQFRSPYRIVYLFGQPGDASGSVLQIANGN